MLPLFAKNNCASLRETADQLFCGDPDLNALAPRLSAAVEARLKADTLHEIKAVMVVMMMGRNRSRQA